MIRALNLVAKNATNLTMASSPSMRRQMSTQLNFETLEVTNPHEFVFHVKLNRPQKRNAMNPTFFKELKECFLSFKYNEDCRSIVLSGNGKSFTAGLDLSDLGSLTFTDMDDVGRKAFAAGRIIEAYQSSISSVEICHKPVIALVHGFCVGGGLDLITACDIRYCTKDAWFTVKEVDIGLAADIGTLQRLPKVSGNDSLVRELVYTARNFSSDEAKQIGLVSKVLADEASLLSEGIELAKVIASKSPIAVQGSKINLIYSRDHSVEEGLKFMTAWNSSMLQSEDLIKAAMASMSKEKATFSKL